MAQSLSKLYIHLIFHIKVNSVTIRNEDKRNLFVRKISHRRGIYADKRNDFDGIIQERLY